MNSQDLNIFLSSTYVDLKDVREKILKFLGVLKSDVINMEVFGSDESQPKEYCLEKVRESNFFIGIYAERYGFVDSETGLSITQLEYIEAYKKLENGELKGLLLYVLDQNSSWPILYVDRDPEKIEKMAAFKKEISQRHTLSYFKDINELPFNVLRDTIRKLEIGQKKYLKERIKNHPVLKGKLERPIGMEFFSQELSNLFFGRQGDIENLNSQILAYNFTLLIGVSGIGKTSLLNAGVMSTLELLGWTTCVIRPLNDPLNNLKKLLWSQLMEGVIPTDFELADIVRAVLANHINRKVLIIIDQFEDILNCKSQAEVDDVIYSLMQLHLLKDSNLHLLISYRGDVESELGMIWQKISGAADGFPRYYLKALSADIAMEVLEKTLRSLGVQVETEILKIIITDLHIESMSNGYTNIFPPFLQMVLAAIFDYFETHQKFKLEDYTSLDGSKGIIGGYLLNQLNYLGYLKEDGITTLIALVSNYGTKTQKNIEEIEFETQIEKYKLSNILAILVDLRLIRLIDSYYEITHDLLAKNILTTLVTEEELNIRKFKFLLESKAAAYLNTNSGLTLSEHLFLYKYRNRINCSFEEFQLLIISKSTNRAPIFFWANSKFLQQLELDELFAFNDREELLYPYCVMPENILPDLFAPKEKTVISLSKSTKEEKLNYFYKYCKDYYINDLTNEQCIFWITSKKKWQQLTGLIGLGNKGGKRDYVYLKTILSDHVSDSKVKLIAFKSIIHLLKKENLQSKFKEILNTYNGDYAEFIIEEVDSTFKKGASIAYLFDLLEEKLVDQRSYTVFILKIIAKISEKSDSNEIKARIHKRLVLEKKYFFYADLYIELALSCCDDLDYYLDIIQKTEQTLSFKYSSNVHELIASFVTKQHYHRIKHRVQAEINYFQADRIERKDYNVHGIVNTSNNYFYVWIIACAFCRDVRSIDKILLFSLLDHYLWGVRNAATRSLLNIGQKADIDILLNMVFKEQENADILKALRLLDAKCFMTGEIVQCLKNMIEPHILIDQLSGFNSEYFTLNDKISYASDELPF